eukprot:CAMPEP_0197718812 /NCGR_PEP_ID=MMETSP1434-20131217/2816_1 /TAXON_ID=265543 /ORGANISM="Minutocellus polymorphus, Strain CCMP3303" /LENGTH=34 /DNA_ID= /DNA_START= /DNA_END= /DNA_ORIENTATION=
MAGSKNIQPGATSTVFDLFLTASFHIVLASVTSS